jgi:hypothetical protein
VDSQQFIVEERRDSIQREQRKSTGTHKEENCSVRFCQKSKGVEQQLALGAGNRQEDAVVHGDGTRKESRSFSAGHGHMSGFST